jgi:hypothetical protein
MHTELLKPSGVDGCRGVSVIGSSALLPAGRAHMHASRSCATDSFVGFGRGVAARRVRAVQRETVASTLKATPSLPVNTDGERGHDRRPRRL